MAGEILSHQGAVEAVEAFVARDGIREPLRYLLNALPADADLYLVGGAIRNLLIEKIHGASPPTMDIDLFIGNVGSDFHLSRLVFSETFEHTDLGGIRWHPVFSKYAFDLGVLSEFIIIKKYRLEPSVENLLATLDFDVNAVVFDIRRSILHERRCIRAIQRRTLDFNSPRFFDKLLLAYRVLVINSKIRFLLSPDVFHFIKDAVDFDTFASLMPVLKSKVGKERTNVILDDYDFICRCKDYEDYRERVGRFSRR